MLRLNNGESNKCSSRGFTLIELIVAVVLLAIVAGITIHYLVSASQLYALLLAKKQADSEVMGVVSRMRREARLHVQTLATNSSAWTFSNSCNAINTTFSLSGTGVELNTNRLARRVERFELKYYNATNGRATNCASIRRVALDIKATNNMAASELKVNFFLQEDLLK